jgi:hypothetical protein
MLLVCKVIVSGNRRRLPSANTVCEHGSNHFAPLPHPTLKRHQASTEMVGTPPLHYLYMPYTYPLPSSLLLLPPPPPHTHTYCPRCSPSGVAPALPP